MLIPIDVPAVRFPYMAFSIVFSLVLSHWEYLSCRQFRQLPHAIGKETTTRSPALILFASGPVVSTIPQHSCPRTSPFSSWGMTPVNGH